MVLQLNKQNHILLVSFPTQGHINPSLQFSERLINLGAHVTFFTSVFGQQLMLKSSSSIPDGLVVAPFSDGFDEGCRAKDDADHYMSEVRRCGSDALSELVEKLAREGCPVSFLIYTIALPWAAQVALKYQLPSALLWVQPATVFDVYYHYFNDANDFDIDNINNPSYTVKFPGLPLLKAEDLPSYLLPSNSQTVILNLIREQFELLGGEAKLFPILVNTFDELESEALNAIDKFKLIGVGPLIPSFFLDASKDYIKWLGSKGEASVVYVSLGSVAVLASKQMEELARGLVVTGRPFLWVIRSGKDESKPQVMDKDEDEEYRRILREEEHKGMIVPWCSQVEVLNHPSIGCFVSHCGWNSTLETMAAGVPVVAAFPQWADQGTNAKLIEDVWKIGVRVRPNEEDKIVRSEEIVRCIKEVMEAEKGEEARRNAKKWRDSAREAAREGGSSDRNLQAFVQDIGRQQCL